MSAFKIGTSHSEDELFSQINMHAMVADGERIFLSKVILFMQSFNIKILTIGIGQKNKLNV